MQHAASKPARAPSGPLAGMRIRKKLIVLHTLFSALFAAALLLALRPAVLDIVAEAEGRHAAMLLTDPAPLAAAAADEHADVRTGTAADLAIDPRDAATADAAAGAPVEISPAGGQTRRARALSEGYAVASVRLPEAREAVGRVYLLVVVALLAVYGLIAVALEVFVLPQHVYGPIRRLLEADRAVQRGERERELVPEDAQPADEMGEIMRSRNEAIRSLRLNEAARAAALDQLETVAADLKRKNHLLENARRNLEGADRLASLGMMSAGIAHELNTPLAVAKGLVEKLAADPGRGLPRSEADLLRRVVGRLERLSDSLLDFARARDAAMTPVRLAGLVEEAITLVRLDRGATGVDIASAIPPALEVSCDGDRMIQVFVNLIRNATDALVERAGGRGTIRVRAAVETRDDGRWVSVCVEDDGPGIDPEVLPRLFEPFATSRLDSRGTGLGLAVAGGIVQEHGGTIIARNRGDRRGAVFEIVLPQRHAADYHPAPARAAGGTTGARSDGGLDG